MEPKTQGPAGHRVLPHTADTAIEAWAPSRGACAEEAARGLLECFLDTEDAQPAGAITLEIGPDSAENMLLAVLDELIYWTDVGDEVPVDSEIAEQPDGHWHTTIWTAPRDQVEVVGAVPKAVTLHEFAFAPDTEATWRCRVLLDV